VLFVLDTGLADRVLGMGRKVSQKLRIPRWARFNCRIFRESA
jgi:hypothetical protein